MADTIYRQWLMLRMVPREPLKIDTQTLKCRLSSEGYEVTQRTIQRDLQALSLGFPLICDEDAKPFRWCWPRDARLMDVPALSPDQALVFHFVHRYMDQALPGRVLDDLKPYFNCAEHVLDDAPGKGVPEWRKRLRVLPRGPRLKSPDVSDEIRHAVQEALMFGRKLQVEYSPRWQEPTRQYEINPLGLVLKDGVLYLVCSIRDYPDIRLLVLHRMLKAQTLDKPASTPDGFDLDDHIASGELAFREGQMIQLKLRVSPGVAYHLIERPLADDQTITNAENDWKLIEATVLDTSELRWWLLGFGDQIEVIAPGPLREMFQQIASSMHSRYSADP
ncbi:MAG: WYL domain-containing protein [Mariprofundaceae bacterium]